MIPTRLDKQGYVCRRYFENKNTWRLCHNTKKNTRIIILANNDDGKLVFPSSLRIENENTVIAEFPTKQTGHLSAVFMPIDWTRSVTVSDIKEITIENKWKITNLLIRCWNTQNEVVYPKTERTNTNNIYLAFTAPFTGRIEVFKCFDIFKMTPTKIKQEFLLGKRQFKHKNNTATRSVNSDGETFFPKEEHKIDEDLKLVNDNRIKFELTNSFNNNVEFLIISVPFNI